MTPETASHIRSMEEVCRLAAETLQHTGKHVKPGISTNELDQIANDFILSRGAVSACIGYHGYPKAICTSVNEVICHGLPDGRVLKDGDIINLDVTVKKNGFFGDTSSMFFAGTTSEKAKKLADCAFQAMHKGIEEAVHGATTGDIGFAVNKLVTKQGYHVVKEIGGHSIGTVFHGDLWIPSYGKKGRGEKLPLWQCITVEPMVNETATKFREIKIPNSEITVVETIDGTWSAQYEHTILITDKEPRILTLV